MASASARAVDIDEMPLFRENNRLKLSTFEADLTSRVTEAGGVGFVGRGADKNQFSLFSKKRDGPVYLFVIFFTLTFVEDSIKEILYEAYSGLKLIKHSTLKTVKTWDQFDELLRFVRLTDSHVDKKVKHLERQVVNINTPKNTKVYSNEDLLKAFSWYTISRTLYNKLRDYLTLPSLSTLQNLTRLARSTDDSTLFQTFFMKQVERARWCIIIVDEVHVRAALTYSGK